MNTARFRGRAAIAASLLVLAPSLAHAHTGTGAVSGFAHGFAHPLLGIDHLLAMIAIGLFAAQRGGRALWAVPAAFVALMVAGFALRAGGIVVPAVELGIAASVLVLGAMVAGRVGITTVAAAAIAGALALFHGHAHGGEMPAAALSATYALGFVLATALLHAAGITLVLSARSGSPHLAVDRCAGAFIAAAGVLLLL